MKKIGITGGIGSGKSYVCRKIAQRGIPIYSTDDHAKLLMTQDPQIIEGLKQLIGPDTYIGGQLNRPLIAQYLFSDPTHAAQVNAIVHPAVKRDFCSWASRQTSDIVVQECAILFESGFATTVDITVEVYAPRDIRIQRACQRDHATPAQIEARMKHQMDEEDKRQLADLCILNDGTADIDKQIDMLLKQISNR